MKFLFALLGAALPAVLAKNDVITLSQPGGMYTNTKVLQDGRPVASYYNPGVEGLMYSVCDDAACSSHTTVDLATGGRMNSFELNSKGNPFFAFCDPDSHVQFLSCQTPTCDSTTKFSTSHSCSMYVNVAIRDDDVPVVAYYSGSDVRVAVCESADSCKEPTINKISVKGKYPSIALDDKQIPHVSYYNDDKNSLGYAVCSDSECSSSKLVTLDKSSDEVGRYNSLQFTDDGLPAIMYVDEALGYLKFASCDSSDCSGKVSTNDIDFVGINAYGEFPKLEINPSNGDITMAYYQQTNSTSGTVRLATCAAGTYCSDGGKVTDIATGGCGFGRDASVGFGKGSTHYVTCMDYDPDASKRKAVMVVVDDLSEMPLASPRDPLSKPVDACS